MRILHVSDFHFNRRWFDWLSDEAPRCDVICFSGDWLDRHQTEGVNIKSQIRWVVEWLKHTPGVLIGCTGNHDWWAPADGVVDLNSNGGWMRLACRAGLFMDGDLLEIAGNKFYAQPWGESILEHDKSSLAVLLAHAPPAGLNVSFFADADRGSTPAALTACGLAPGSIVLSGHVHTPKVWHDKVGETWCFNPGVNREAHVPNYILIDKDEGIARASVWGETDEVLLS